MFLLAKFLSPKIPSKLHVFPFRNFVLELFVLRVRFKQTFLNILTLLQNFGWGFLNIGCSESYLGLRGANWEVSGKDYIIRIFMTCTHQIFFSGWSNQEDWDGRVCSMYGGWERCIQDFGREIWGKETTWKTQDLQKFGLSGARTELIWPRIGTGCGLL